MRLGAGAVRDSWKLPDGSRVDSRAPRTRVPSADAGGGGQRRSGRQRREHAKSSRTSAVQHTTAAHLGGAAHISGACQRCNIHQRLCVRQRSTERLWAEAVACAERCQGVTKRARSLRQRAGHTPGTGRECTAACVRDPRGLPMQMRERPLRESSAPGAPQQGCAALQVLWCSRRGAMSQKAKQRSRSGEMRTNAR